MRVAIFVFTLLFANQALADNVKIATWNLGGFYRIPIIKVDQIVRGLEILEADVVVLPEINPLSHAQLITTKLKEKTNECFKWFAPDQPRASQEIAIIYKCEVTLVKGGIVKGSDLNKRGYRNAVVAHMKSAEFDFVIFGLHLKASRGPTNRAYRSSQLGFVSGYIQSHLLTGEKDYIVIGDYNMIPGQDDENFEILETAGKMRFITTEDHADGFSHISSGGPGNLLDGFGFLDIDQSEYKNGSIQIVQMHDLMGLSLAQFANTVTDHLPIIATFSNISDND